MGWKGGLRTTDCDPAPRPVSGVTRNLRGPLGLIRSRTRSRAGMLQSPRLRLARKQYRGMLQPWTPAVGQGITSCIPWAGSSKKGSAAHRASPAWLLAVLRPHPPWQQKAAADPQPRPFATAQHTCKEGSMVFTHVHRSDLQPIRGQQLRWRRSRHKISHPQLAVGVSRPIHKQLPTC